MFKSIFDELNTKYEKNSLSSRFHHYNINHFFIDKNYNTEDNEFSDLKLISKSSNFKRCSRFSKKESCY